MSTHAYLSRQGDRSQNADHRSTDATLGTTRRSAGGSFDWYETCSSLKNSQLMGEYEVRELFESFMHSILSLSLVRICGYGELQMWSIVSGLKASFKGVE